MRRKMRVLPCNWDACIGGRLLLLVLQYSTLMAKYMEVDLR